MSKPVLDTPLPPNVKGPPTHKPWRRVITDGTGTMHELRHWQQPENGWLVTYWNVNLPFSNEGRRLTHPEIVATWEPTK